MLLFSEHPVRETVSHEITKRVEATRSKASINQMGMGDMSISGTGLCFSTSDYNEALRRDHNDEPRPPAPLPQPLAPRLPAPQPPAPRLPAPALPPVPQPVPPPPVDPNETFRCSQCRREYRADGFNVDRLGRRRKGCKQCSETNRRYRAAKASKVYNPCPHGRNSGSQCSHCDREGYQRMTALRDFHRFQKLDS